MGIHSFPAKFLIQAKQGGTNFGKTVTLGRQGMFISPVRLLKLLKKSNCLPPGLTDETFYREQFSSPYIADSFLKVLGATEVTSLDFSDYEGAAIVHDLNEPIPDHLKGQFDTVIDGGTLEHVFNFPVAIKNCMELLRPGGTLFIITPANNHFGHGFYQFSAELFYRVLSAANGFEMQRMHVAESEIFEGKLGKRRIAVQYEGKHAAVSDPIKVHHRVYLATRMPVYMLVQAKKLRDANIFSKTPQQSDYEVSWQAPAAEHGGKLAYNEKWASLKDLQLFWLPLLCRLNPLFFWSQLRRRSIKNSIDFQRVD